MAKGPTIKYLQGQGACSLIHYPLQDTLTAINDIQRQEYNREFICKYSHYDKLIVISIQLQGLNIYTYFKGVSDGGDEELLCSGNLKRLLPCYKTRLLRTRKKLNRSIRSNNTLMGVVQPTISSRSPPNLTPAQQQIQAQKQAYDAQVAASQIAPPSTQTAIWWPLFSLSRVTPRGARSGLATDSRSRKSRYQARIEANDRTWPCSRLLFLQNKKSYVYTTDEDSESYTKSSADMTDTNQKTLADQLILASTDNETGLQDFAVFASYGIGFSTHEHAPTV
ncbi:hypothetical protein EAE96_000028 [Botrytis aclada]|nr:hypothetical protein EAE96_000028 [Botrytis aclada]